MKRISLLFAGLLSLILLANRAPAAEGWEPEKTWVFVVGLLEWEHPKLWASFPAAFKDRRDEQFAEFFKEAGVPKEQVVFLKDSVATKAHTASEFKKFLQKTDEDDFLIFYFAGHGARNPATNETWFATYDATKLNTAWNVRDIFQTIEDHFSGNRALLLADCCHSGALYDEAKKRKDSDIAYAALTSSYSHNTSTGNWTFSDSVLAGLRGEGIGDLDGDGEITLEEIANYAEVELAFIEGQKSMLYASDGLPATTEFAKSEQALKKGVGHRLEVEWKGKWYKAKTIDAEDEKVKVRYMGFDSSWDEWVGPERRREYSPTKYDVNAKVQVLWTGDKKWYPAKVLKSWNGLHFVRYDGYDSTWDEWIGPHAIRPRPE